MNNNESDKMNEIQLKSTQDKEYEECILADTLKLTEQINADKEEKKLETIVNTRKELELSIKESLVTSRTGFFHNIFKYIDKLKLREMLQLSQWDTNQLKISFK